MSLRHILIANCAALIVVGNADARPHAPGAVVPDAQVATRLAQAAPAAKGKKAKKKAKLAKKRAKVRERIRALRAWRLTEALDLDEATAAKLFPILGQYDARFEKALQGNSELRAQARAELDQPAPDAKKLDSIVEQMLKQQRALWDLQEARFKAVRNVLTPAQTAKILIVLPEIDRTLQRQIRRAMRGDAGEVKDPFRGKPRAPRRGNPTPLNPFD